MTVLLIFVEIDVLLMCNRCHYFRVTLADRSQTSTGLVSLCMCRLHKVLTLLVADLLAKTNSAMFL